MANETETLKARIAQLEAQLAQKAKISFKVSEKGALSVYGLQRFPVTLYLEQWTRLLAAADQMHAFITANKSRLTVKAPA